MLRRLLCIDLSKIGFLQRPYFPSSCESCNPSKINTNERIKFHSRLPPGSLCDVPALITTCKKIKSTPQLHHKAKSHTRCAYTVRCKRQTNGIRSRLTATMQNDQRKRVFNPPEQSHFASSVYCSLMRNRMTVRVPFASR